MEEIENFYKQELEKADFEYLQSINKNISRKDAEKNYLKKIKKIREEYYQKYKKFLLNEKKSIRKKELNEKKEKFKRFKSESFDLNLGFFEKFKIKKDILLFNQKRKSKNLVSRITPNFILYSLAKIKKRKNKISQESSEDYQKTKESLLARLKDFSVFFKNLTEKLIKILENTSNKIFAKFQKEKKEKK